MDIAIIPARSGSKRIKNKNIKLFDGKPLIYYSINAAKKSKLFDRIIVSTDSEKISKIAIKYGAEAPFIRPKELSDDFTSTQDVIRHAIKKINNLKNMDNVCCIYATAPFINFKDLIKAKKILNKRNKSYIFTASKFNSSIYRSFYLKNKKLIKVFPKLISSRTQDLKDTFFDVGQFYYASKKTWLNKKIFSIDSEILEIPTLMSYDLNTIEDWNIIQKINKIFKTN